MTELVRYEAMCHAIAECHRVDEVKDLRDKALALQMYAQQARNTDAERKACAVRLRAERRAGELLAGMEKNRGAEGLGSNQYEVRSRDETAPSPTLADMGITKGQSSRWQQLAAVPDAQFERALADPEAMPSTARLIKAARSQDERTVDAALWTWSRAREFEGDRIGERKPDELLGQMTAAMQADMARIVPTQAEFYADLRGVLDAAAHDSG